MENGFDELKNQWGWGGFTTRDLTRCRHMARLIALTYNWWSLFVRLADPDHHREAITSRPPLLHGVARQTHHAGQTRLTVTSHHGRREAVVAALRLAARRLLPGPDAKCGTVERRGSLAPHARRGAQDVPSWPRAKQSTLAADPSGRASVLKSTPKSTIHTAPTGRSRPPTAGFRFGRSMGWRADRHRIRAPINFRHRSRDPPRNPADRRQERRPAAPWCSRGAERKRPRLRCRSRRSVPGTSPPRGR